MNPKAVETTLATPIVVRTDERPSGLTATTKSEIQFIQVPVPVLRPYTKKKKKKKIAFTIRHTESENDNQIQLRVKNTSDHY